MGRTSLLVLCILSVLLACVSAAAAYYDPYPGNALMSAEWKWNYAQSYDETKLEAADVQITGYDIQYARGRVAEAVKDCSNMGGVWCTYADNDRDALQKMLNVQARQEQNPSPAVVDTGTIPDFTNIIDSAWKQLVAIAKGIFGWD